MTMNENKLIQEIETLQNEFTKTTTKLIKDVKRQDKIMSRSDKRQQKEYDELQRKFEEVEELQKRQKTHKKKLFLLWVLLVNQDLKRRGTM